jgi:para-aminobenzoate synthetase / 4-amino-4-deoxychorismate lyase
MSTAPAQQNTPAAIAPPAADPAHGVFETLLVAAGEPVELDAHLARLSASLVALFGAEPPPGLATALRQHARGIELARLRIAVAPSSSAAAAGAAATADPRPASDSAWRVETALQEVESGDVFPGPERGAELRTLACAGGLGRHKWADRRALAAVGAGAVPLLVDAGAEVLEAGRANVFAARAGALFTAADDGRILPGIARAGAIAAARAAGIEVREGPLTREELFAADEVFLTGSVRGIEPAASLDGAPLPAAGALSRAVAAGLRSAWRLRARS